MNEMKMLVLGVLIMFGVLCAICIGQDIARERRRKKRGRFNGGNDRKERKK